MRLSQMTVRRWMIVAAVVGLLLTVDRYERRRKFCLGQIIVNSSMERLYRIDRNGRLDYGDLKHPIMYCNREQLNNDDTLKSEYVKLFMEQHAYFDALVRKYRYAASHPWTDIEPDPPPPQ
jgi:hypothetical protein